MAKPKRTVRFFEITDENGNPLEDDLSMEDLSAHILALPEGEAYRKLSRFVVLGSAHPTYTGERPAVPLIALDRITKDVGLRIEQRRQYRPLELADDETLAEPTFYSLFPRNVLAVMRNSGSAPSHASFRDYVNGLDVLSGGEIGISPLADLNALRALGEVGVLTEFFVEVDASATEEDVAAVPFIRDAIRTLRQSQGPVTMGISVKIEVQGMDSASTTTLQQVRGLVTSEGMARMNKASIHYRNLETGRAETYDFFSESIATQVEVELLDSVQQPTERSAAEAIARAYNDECYDDLQSALNARHPDGPPA